MIARLNVTPMAPQEYLEWESTQESKYAYVNGEVFAMTGGTIPHNQIALNLASALKAHLRGKGCLVVMAGVKVEVSQNGPYHYPDVMVSCDERVGVACPEDIRNAIKLIRYPSLIVEVLSPSTADYDRGNNFTHYRQIPTLQEYVLISADQISVDRYRRISSRRWDLQTYIETETLSLASVDWQAPIELLYEDVRFAENAEEG
ncbi:Uma2 family endonuclease [Nodosilinea sp. AN01ver1]|uniref:Uma2 family endonuclease n=1 Tax=Nodosilinea sp. AN01ver1 TaxID=3423362 RepID=UPI003D316FC2